MRFTKALAKELDRFGVQANVVAPGMAESDMTARMSDKARTKPADAIPLPASAWRLSSPS
ncbi:hypothetical protein ACFFG9_00320 [Kutzneria buriramensis]|uniref:hypothetical protein n=1 Tax=Kutzneria buriramensis TaxID=1045776 RepID=UPI0035EB43E2